MRLIDADKLHPDRMTNKGDVAISQSQIAKAPTVNAVSEEVYTEEFNLRKDAELKVYKLEKAIDEIRAEIKEESYSKQCFNDDVYEYEDRCVDLEDIFRIIDEKVKEYKV